MDVGTWFGILDQFLTQNVIIVRSIERQLAFARSGSEEADGEWSMSGNLDNNSLTAFSRDG